MTWHYQVMKDKNGTFGVHEYYPNIGGKAAWTAKPVAVEGEDLKEIIYILTAMLEDIEAHGVKELPDEA